MQLAAILLLLHTIYRIIEVAFGFRSDLAQNEVAFMIANGTFPLLACILLAAFPPGAAFGPVWAETTPTHHSAEHTVTPLHSPNAAYDPYRSRLMASGTYEPRYTEKCAARSVEHSPRSIDGLYQPFQQPAASPASVGNTRLLQSPALSPMGYAHSPVSPHSPLRKVQPARKSTQAARGPMVDSESLW
jgi:hypothetical protein